MDTPQLPNPRILAHIRETVTQEFLEKLIHYALKKLGQKTWRGVWGGKIPGGVQAEDLAVAAIEAVLVGDPEQGGRVWDPDREPNLMNFLRDVIDSMSSHLAERSENTKGREPRPKDGESEGDYFDRKRDHRSLVEEAAALSAEDEAANERLFFALLDEVKDDPLLQQILECKWDGIIGRTEIAKKLKVDVNAITQAGKRLNRILPQFREKHAHLNPFKNR